MLIDTHGDQGQGSGNGPSNGNGNGSNGARAAAGVGGNGPHSVIVFERDEDLFACVAHKTGGPEHLNDQCPLSSGARILAIDEDRDAQMQLRQMLADEGHHVRIAGDAAEALDKIVEAEPDVVIMGMQTPGVEGIPLLAELRLRAPNAMFVLSSASGSLGTAVDGIKAGAFDFLCKPYRAEDVRLVVRGAVEHQYGLGHALDAPTAWELAGDEPQYDNIVGSSPGMLAVYKMIARVAETDSTILLEGESGTGKELVARAIHSRSLRRDGPFVAVDGGALAESLLESELFGHERGAFTGAVASKKGLLEKAHGGTCFLDEIADISPVVQSKLPRVLQEREIRRVGRTEPLAVDVRIIAASNKNLKALVDAGKFREDLYYRLNVVTITIPPLRERTEDIPLLVHFFTRKYAEAQGKAGVQIAPETMALLVRHPWPGNVRELEHVIERAVALAPCPVILPADLPDALHQPPPENGDKGWRTLAQLEQDYILRVLEAHHHDLARAARVLGVHRKTLQRKLRRYHSSETTVPEEARGGFAMHEPVSSPCDGGVL